MQHIPCVAGRRVWGPLGDSWLQKKAHGMEGPSWGGLRGLTRSTLYVSSGEMSKELMSPEAHPHCLRICLDSEGEIKGLARNH